MTECKDGQCACCNDISTTIETDMGFIDKLRAHIKGDTLGKLLNEREYYYLMFGCVNAKQISEVKEIGEKLKDAIDLGNWYKAELIIKEMNKYQACGWGVK